MRDPDCNDHDDPDVLVPDALPDLEPEPEEDELYRELCELCLRDGDWVWLCLPGEHGVWEANGFLAVSLLAPTLPACSPKLSNEGTEKQAIGRSTVVTFGAPLRLWISS